MMHSQVTVCLHCAFKHRGSWLVERYNVASQVQLEICVPAHVILVYLFIVLLPTYYDFIHLSFNAFVSEFIFEALKEVRFVNLGNSSRESLYCIMELLFLVISSDLKVRSPLVNSFEEVFASLHFFH